MAFVPEQEGTQTTFKRGGKGARVRPRRAWVRCVRSPHDRPKVGVSLVGLVLRSTDDAEEGQALTPGIRGFVVGATSVLLGARRIAADRALRRLLLIPLVLTSLAYLGLVAGGVYLVPRVLAGLWEKPEGVLLGLLWIGVAVLVVVALLAALALVFTTVVETLGGPFYDKMVAHVLSAHAIHVEEPGFFDSTVPDLVRAVVLLVPTALFGFLGIFFAPFAFVATFVASIGFASAAINPSLLVTGHDLGARMRYVFRSFGAMLGLGGMMTLSMMVPFLAVVSIPSAMVGVAELYAKSQRSA